MLSFAGVLGNYQPRIHLDPATEDYMFERHCAMINTLLPCENERQSQTFFFLLLDPRAQDSWCTGTANTASFACILAKRACMIKTSRYVPYELLENNLGLQNIYLCFMGFEEYSIGC